MLIRRTLRGIFCYSYQIYRHCTSFGGSKAIRDQLSRLLRFPIPVHQSSSDFACNSPGFGHNTQATFYVVGGCCGDTTLHNALSVSYTFASGCPHSRGDQPFRRHRACAILAIHENEFNDLLRERCCSRYREGVCSRNRHRPLL